VPLIWKSPESHALGELVLNPDRDPIGRDLVDPATVDAIIDQFEHNLGPKIGAAVVAKAWADPA
jgi:nitrile hydratase alpha subunit